MQSKKNKLNLRKIFLFTLLFKGVYGFLKILGGMFILLVDFSYINNLFLEIFKNEIIEDPSDFIIGKFIGANALISPSTIQFIGIYLIVHGVINVGIAYSILAKKKRTYLIVEMALLIMVAYQIVRVLSNHSIFLLLLTLIDIFILIFFNKEHKMVKKNAQKT